MNPAIGSTWRCSSNTATWEVRAVHPNGTLTIESPCRVARVMEVGFFLGVYWLVR